MEERNLTDALRPGPECPSIERLGRYADGSLPPDERRHEESHIVACPNCQAELTLLYAFMTAAVRDDDAAAVGWGVEQLRRREPEIFAGRRHERFPRQWLPIANWRAALVLAGVLLAVAGGYYLTNPATPRLPNDIGSSVEPTRSLTIAVRAPLGDQTAVPDRLQWELVIGAARYRVRLSEVDLPPDVRARIVPGKTLVWQVTAYNAANAPLAESGAARFRLVP